MVEVTNNDGTKISGFLPEAMKVPFGVEPGMEDKTRMSAQLMIPSRESPIVDFFRKVDDHIMTWIVANSVTLFKKKMSMDLVKELFIPTLKMPENAGQRPLVRVKMNQETGKFPTKVILKLNADEYTAGNITNIASGSFVHVVIEVGCLWFISKRCGVSLMATKVMIEPGTEMKTISPSDFGVSTQMRCVATPQAAGAGGCAASSSVSSCGANGFDDAPAAAAGGGKRKAEDDTDDESKKAARVDVSD